MFGLSLPELLVIFGVVLIFFGPEHLPELARKLGKFSAELKKTSDSVRREFYNSVYTPVQGDLDASKRALTSFKEALIEDYSPDPNCPDYQAKLKAEAAALPADTTTSEAIAPDSSSTPVEPSASAEKVKEETDGNK